MRLVIDLYQGYRAARAPPLAILFSALGALELVYPYLGLMSGSKQRFQICPILKLRSLAVLIYSLFLSQLLNRIWVSTCVHTNGLRSPYCTAGLAALREPNLLPGKPGDALSYVV